MHQVRSLAALIEIPQVIDVSIADHWDMEEKYTNH